jgi:hypothetical protein
MSAAYLDARVYALYDKIRALCYGPIGRDIHGYDEKVSLRSVQRITTAIALFIADWRGLEPVALKPFRDSELDVAWAPSRGVALAVGRARRLPTWYAHNLFGGRVGRWLRSSLEQISQVIV